MPDAATTFGPWTLSGAEFARLEVYRRCAALLSRKAKGLDELFQRDLADAKLSNRYLPHLYLRLPRLITGAAADLVLSQPPVLRSQDAAVQERVTALAARSRLWLIAWRAVKWTCALGDGFFVIADKGKLPVLTFRRAVGVVARNVRVEDPAESRAFLFESPLPGGLKLYTEHVGGAIKNTAYKDGQAASLPTGFAPEIETQETIPLAVHLATLHGSDEEEEFGGSDVEAIEEFSFEIANRLRQVQKILDRHAEPPMNVPGGTLDEGGVLDVRNKKVFERDASGQGADYITWQSQLDAAFSEIDRIVDLALLMTETPPALFGRAKDGGQAESGRALKFRLLSGLGKARRNGSMLSAALIEAARLALRREDILAGRTPQPYPDLACELPDTFIADDMDTSQFVGQMRSAGAMSVRAGVRIGQGLLGKELDAEVAEIAGETPAAPTPGFGPSLTS